MAAKALKAEQDAAAGIIDPKLTVGVAAKGAVPGKK
jgi:hypothetical protein